MAKTEKGRQDSQLIGLPVGLMVGTAIGCWTDNLGLWMCVGVSVGLWIDAVIGKKQSKAGKDNAEDVK